jgi:hypothetical protein
MYCVKLLDPLREKFGFFTEGNEENEGFRSGGGQSLCFLCCLLFRIFGCAASTNTAGSASTPAFAQLRRGRQRTGYNIL